MRRTRRLILVLIAAIVAGVAVVYSVQRDTQVRNAPSLPAALPESVSARAADWMWEKDDKGRPIVRVFAKDFKHVDGGKRIALDHVTLHLFHKDGKAYDEVKSAKADFDVEAKQLVSDGEVEITIGLQAEAPKTNGLVHIKTSGVKFDSQTGAASTEREAWFKFDRGEGKALGAKYDPSTRQLYLQNEVSLTWTGDSPDDKPMNVQAGSLLYQEAESQIILTPWSKFQRDTLNVEGANSIVKLEEGVIRQINALQAKGMDTREKRQLEFAADELRLQFNERGVMEHVTGENNARLASIAKDAQTNVTTNRVEMEFEIAGPDSLLKKAIALGKTIVESKPVPRSGAPTPDTRIVRSEVVSLYMRNGGEEIERVETETPGTMEFVPNRPGQKRRFMTGERMYMHYGAANQLKSFRAVTVSTRTEPEQPAGKPALPPALTWSKDLAAEFNPKTGVMEKLEQWDDFRYEEGDRNARAQKATLTSAKDEIALSGAARFWDPTGSTSADVIVMNQKSGDFAATGNVNSTRMPDRKKKQEPGMLSGEEPVHAKAARMNSSTDNTLIRYEGGALMWQGANRLQGDQISIDRKQGTVAAEGQVVSQLLDNSESKTADAKKKPSIYTIVKAPKMVYSDKERLAHYSGGAVLTRAATTVNAREIRAFLKQGEQNSSLERALADGAVKIVQVTPERTRTGVCEHAEYYTENGRVILADGKPELIDSVKGVTRGKQLTYFSNSDKLLVEGGQGQPVETKLRRN